jgi:adenine-specific DNA-methyltransferase
MKQKMNKHKLELTWIGKGQNPKLEPRILIEDPEKSYGDKSSDNMLIHGDNLLALKALEQDYSGKIKCIYIDPPFNTGAAFENYYDGLEHSIWLDLMSQRIEKFKKLLSPDGSIFVHLDDNEVDYCKILLDQVFGRSNFINRITIEARSPSAFSTVNPGVFKSSEYMLWYANDKSAWKSKSMRIPTLRDTAYNKYIDNKSNKVDEWILKSLKVAFLEKLNVIKVPYIKNFVENLYSFNNLGNQTKTHNFIKESFPFKESVDLKKLAGYLYNKVVNDSNHQNTQKIYEYILEKVSSNYSEREVDKFVVENADSIYRDTEISDEGAGQEIVRVKHESLKTPNKIFKLERQSGLDTIYVLNGKQLAFYSKNVIEIDGKKTPTKFLTNVWTDISWEGIAKEGNVTFKKGKKPERLIKRCLELTTEEGDFVLDSFLGSGTTIGVSHKMKRKWIGIEFGEQAITHCLPRIKAIVAGDDKTGITTSVNWINGGGFKFYDLAPSLISNDKYGKEIINKEYNPNMLASAMCKHMGFKYNPNIEVYWKQGQSTETDYIYTTTQYVTVEMLDAISEEMKPEETILICSKSYDPKCEDKYPSINIKKIPQVILGKCEFGIDNYDLNIIKATEEIAEDIEDNLIVI